MDIRRHTILVALAALTVALFAVPADAQTRGYISRGCGFDLDGDGVIGEPNDDCNICDGQTLDPDGDGTNEDLIYVNCDSGNDSSSCGAPGSPCRSIQHAWSSRADGPGDGAEDIICFTGTCKTVSDYKIPVSGVGSGGQNGQWYDGRPATGNQVRSFQYSANPTMLVGWDRDNDGNYPPFDTDDKSILDGGSNQLRRGLHFGLLPSHVELAHFTVSDYGRYSSGDGNTGFVRIGTSERSGDMTGIHLHDLRFTGLNQSRRAISTTIGINLFSGGAQLRWIAVENIDARNIGGWFIRGGVGLRGDVGPFRFQNISLTMFHERSSGGHGLKMWGFNRGVEVLDNRFDANPRGWQPLNLNTTTAFAVSACSQDWDIVNNEILDFRMGFWLNSKNYVECVDRPVNDIRFERNIFRNTFAWQLVLPVWVHQEFLEPVDKLTCSTNTDLLDYVVANNFFSSTVGYKACFIDEDGNNCRRDEGTAVFVNNTCHGAVNNGGAAIAFGSDPTNDRKPQNRQQNFVVWNNIITGPGLPGSTSKTNIWVNPVPSNWSAGHNVYDPAGRYRWGSSETGSLSTWQNSSRSDSGSVTCNPTLMNAAGGDLHLASSDGCAIDRGQSMSTIISLDFDAGERPTNSAWDIGADEQGVEGDAGGGGGGGDGGGGDGGGGDGGGGDGGGGDGGGGDGGGTEPPPPTPGLPAPTLREVAPIGN